VADRDVVRDLDDRDVVRDLDDRDVATIAGQAPRA
jgi:hypothetical protein